MIISAYENKLVFIQGLPAMNKSEYQTLLAERDALDKQLVEVMLAERGSALSWIVEQMVLFDIDSRDLYRRPVKVSRKQTRPVAAKYRDPVTGTTWSGRGKSPRWIQGKNRDDFLIR